MTANTLAILQQSPWSNAEEIALLTGLLLLMFLAGRAFVEICLAFARRGSDAGEQPLRNVNFVAIGAGGAMVLIVVWVLRVAHLFSFGAAIGVLAAFVAAVAIWNAPFREFLRRPWREFDALLGAYAAGSFAFLLAADVNTYQFRTSSGLYIQSGWQLFSGASPQTYPSFGHLVEAPLLYAGHLVLAVFGILGHADHVAYYIVGTYWVNCILAPAVPIGAYLLFSRFLPAVPSAVAAWFFCTETLGNKVWSLRGETIGWIVGFCFLLAVVDAVRGLEDSKTARSCARLWPLVGTLFFALVLTHGIAAAIAVIAVAFAGVHVLLRRNLYAVIPIVRLAAFAGICTVVLLTVFALTYAHSTSVIEKGVHSPAGAQDAAIAHDNAWDGLPLDFDPRPVHVHPPYVPLPAMAEIVAILPPISLFEPSYRSLPIEVFPRLAITELATVPAGVKILVAALPLVLLALCFALPTQRKRWRELFLISLCVCAVLVLVSLFADLRSVALYPVAAVRRSFPYVRFFYWVAIGIAVAEYLELLLRRWAGAEQAWLAARKRVLPGIAALVVSFGWIFSSLNIAVGRTTLGAMLGHVGWGTLAVIDPLLPLTPFEVQETPMLQTMLYVRDHVPIGHWVFSNILSSDDTFSYFTSGRYSLLEGTSIYQLSPLLRREAIDMRTMEIVAASSDTALLKPFGSAYVVTYDRLQCDAQCYGDIVVPTNDSWFASSPALKRVFSNGYYTIYRTTGASDLRVAAQDARLITRCEAWSAEPTATIAACERLVRLSGPIDPAAYYFLARAQLARHQYAAAIEDFNDSIATSPQFALSYYGRALTFAREGRRHEALADLDLAATYGGNEVRIEALRRTLLGAAASDP